MTVNELVSALSASLHDSANRFDLTSLKRMVKTACAETSRIKRPLRRVLSLDLVSGQSLYPLPADAVGISRLSWLGVPGCIDPGPAPVASMAYDAEGRKLMLSPPPSVAAVASVDATLIYTAQYSYATVVPEPPEGPDETIVGLDPADEFLVLLRAQIEAAKELALYDLPKPTATRANIGQARNMTAAAILQQLTQAWEQLP